MDGYTLILALAGLAGFVFEWRRENRRDEEAEQTRQRVAALEAAVGELQAWRDRLGRAQ